MSGRTLFIIDWLAREGTVVGSAIRDGATLDTAYLVADVHFDQDYDQRMVAWLEHFADGDHAFRDLRTVTAPAADRARQAETIILHDGPELQHLVPGVDPVSHALRQIAQETQRRAARRGASPLPSGGLFGDPAPTQQDLFA